ncbi:MAG: SAM-dependent chlorinase/fluorinase [Myxococcota bacterium]
MTLLALSTDFGADSTYVAQLKGVLISRAPGIPIVDVSHSLPVHNIRAAEVFLRAVAFAFPIGTVHAVVVDPGVGTERQPIAVQVKGMSFVGPDNGLFGRLIAIKGSKVVCLDRTHLFRTPVAPTFHGRDIFAPVAAELAAGTPIESVGSEIADTVPSTLPVASVVGALHYGEILASDRFGNLTTNIQCRAGAGYRVEVEGHDKPVPWVQTYGEVERGALVALAGSDGFLELARREQPAGLRVGARVTAETVLP